MNFYSFCGWIMNSGMYVANRASDKITKLTDNVYVCRSGSVRYYICLLSLSCYICTYVRFNPNPTYCMQCIFCRQQIRKLFQTMFATFYTNTRKFVHLKYMHHFINIFIFDCKSSQLVLVNSFVAMLIL